MSPRPRQVSPESIIDELAKVFRDPEEAKLVALRAGFPPADLPAFSTPRVFWSRVIEAVVHGKVGGGMWAVQDAAASFYPGNEAFSGSHPAIGMLPDPAGVALASRSSAARQTILFLTSNASRSNPLALQREAKEIVRKIRAARFGEHFVFSPLGEATPGDFQDALLQERPTIVHFSGSSRGSSETPSPDGSHRFEHGYDVRHGIVMCSDAPGQEMVVDGDALQTTLALYRQHVRIVVLNAGYSLSIASMAAKTVDCAVGVEGPLSSEGGRLFSVGLYRGLAHGETIKAAFAMGVAEMKLGGCKRDAARPRLRWRDGVDPETTRLVTGSVAPITTARQQPSRLHEPIRPHTTASSYPQAGVGSRPKATRREFRQNLDRHRQWSRFRRAFSTPNHLVMWAVGDGRQNLELFCDRIKEEYLREYRHGCHSFGIGPGDDATAKEWEDLLCRSVTDAFDGSLDGAIATAARSRPALFVLDSQRGPLDEDTLSEPHLAELVEFVEVHFLPAVVRVDPPHPVRLFVGIQNRGDSTLAAMLREAVRRARQDWSRRADGGRGIGRWEAEKISLPSRDEVLDSIEELLEPTDPLSEEERDTIKIEHDAFLADRTSGLRDLADRLYPHYLRFHTVRIKDTVT